MDEAQWDAKAVLAIGKHLEESIGKIDKLEAALRTISEGQISEFKGAPDVELITEPLAFSAAMWSWSQRVARHALGE